MDASREGRKVGCTKVKRTKDLNRAMQDGNEIVETKRPRQYGRRESQIGTEKRSVRFDDLEQVCWSSVD